MKTVWRILSVYTMLSFSIPVTRALCTQGSDARSHDRDKLNSNGTTVFFIVCPFGEFTRLAGKIRKQPITRNRFSGWGSHLFPHNRQSRLKKREPLFLEGERLHACFLNEFFVLEGLQINLHI